MRGLLVAGGDTKTGVGIAQVRDRLFATSTCCDTGMTWDTSGHLVCAFCNDFVRLPPDSNVPYELELYLNGRWVPSDVWHFVQDWTGLTHGVDIAIKIDRLMGTGT